VADAVVIPGGKFGPAAGMLMYAGVVAERRGATLHRHTWPEPVPTDPLAAGVEGWVSDEIGALLEAVGDRPLLIAKSLGSNAAALAADRAIPAVWLTPLLTMPWVTAALARATAPSLLVGGTADAWWDPVAARRLSPFVLEVDGADHGLMVPGPLTDSIAVLGRLVTAIDEFLDTIGWPG
jgi:pimeloyl-ACP methyl ester carboxylesterase